MIPNFHFALIFAITITFASGNSNGIKPTDTEAFPLDSIAPLIQVTTTPNTLQSGSRNQIAKQEAEEKPKQGLPISDSVSTGQTQQPQSTSIAPSEGKNKQSERSEQLPPTKGLKTTQSLEASQSEPLTRGEWIGIIVTILVGLISLYSVVLQYKKFDKRDINREVRRSFDVLPWPTTREERKKRELHKRKFYTGSADAHPSVYIRLDLDAERPLVERMVRWIKEKQWFHISIYGDRKQGKTIFMARLAHNLSHQKSLRIFRRRYHVLWCKAGNTPFRCDLKQGKSLDADLFAEYSKYFVPRKHFIFSKKSLIVFIDDIFRPELMDSSGIVEQGSVRSFIEELMSREINVITSSSQEITINETVTSHVLKLTEPDTQCILTKLVKEEVVPTEFANNFPNSSAGRSFYREQLFAFFSSLLTSLDSAVGHKISFIKDFEQSFASLSDPQKLALKMIAICGVVDVYLSGRILEEMFPQSLQLQHSLGGLVRREGHEDTYVFHMGGPFLTKWLLNAKFGVRDFNALLSTYSTLFDHILSKESFSVDSQKTIGLILRRLMAGWHSSIFNISGRPLARALLKSSRTRLKSCLDGLTDAASLVAWASTMKDLGDKELATTLYLKAVDRIQIPATPPTPENMVTPVSLAMGLSDMSERDTKKLAIPLFENIIEKFIAAKTEPWAIRRVVHRLAETLDALNQPKKALETIENLLPKIGLDALLWQKKGDIFIKLRRLPEAKDCFKKSIETARAVASQSPRTLFQCLLHYVHFLSEHSNLTKQSGENTEVYLIEAKRLCDDKKVEGYEVVLNAWAKHKTNEGNASEAKKYYQECISYCRQKGILYPHCWNDFAHLLRTSGSQFNEKSYEKWLSEAENYCWEVINDMEADDVSKRVSYHIVGSLVGSDKYTSLDGKPRPNFIEAVSILQNAFKSPEPERNDDEKKDFQDVITHRALKDIYIRWSDSERLSPEDKKKLIEKADFHIQKAFSGLPRPNLNLSEVIKHALETQVAYAFFKWMRQEDPVAADLHYREAIEKYEKLNCWWPRAYTLYEFYTNFVFSTRKEEYEKLVMLHRKALENIPNDKLKEKAIIQTRLGQCLCFGYRQHLKSKSKKETETKLDEAITAFEAALKQTPENEVCAKVLANLLFAPNRVILTELSTSDRVNRLKDILLQAWVTCPSNVEALDGLFTIGDSLIDKCLDDRETLDDLGKVINSKAKVDKDIANTLCSVCNRRRNKPYRGKLTEMLCGA